MGRWVCALCVLLLPVGTDGVHWLLTENMWTLMLFFANRFSPHPMHWRHESLVFHTKNARIQTPRLHVDFREPTPLAPVLITKIARFLRIINESASQNEVTARDQQKLSLESRQSYHVISLRVLKLCSESIIPRTTGEADLTGTTVTINLKLRILVYQ